MKLTFKFGLANPLGTIDLVSGYYDIWFEQLNKENERFPKKQEPTEITFDLDQPLKFPIK